MREVPERVVHPAHVPFETEAEPAREVGRETPGQAVDSSAASITPGYSRVHELVQLAQEADRLEVLAAAVLVREPLAGLRE